MINAVTESKCVCPPAHDILTALVRLLAREAARVDFATQRISVIGEASHD